MQEFCIRANGLWAFPRFVLDHFNERPFFSCCWVRRHQNDY